MKITYLLSIAAMVSVALAQDPTRDVIAEPIDPSDDASPAHDNDRRPGGFTAWSSPGYKGHIQRTKGSPGCYRLDGGAIASFDGPSGFQYNFYGDDRCRGRFQFGSSSAPVHTIRPSIYPRSVKISAGGGLPDVKEYSGVFWSQENYGGDRQKFDGRGCYDLNGRTIRSIQGTNRYTFYEGARCYGGRVGEYVGSKNRISPISPKSVYIN